MPVRITSPAESLTVTGPRALTAPAAVPRPPAARGPAGRRTLAESASRVPGVRGGTVPTAACAGLGSDSVMGSPRAGRRVAAAPTRVRAAGAAVAPRPPGPGYAAAPVSVSESSLTGTNSVVTVTVMAPAVLGWPRHAAAPQRAAASRAAAAPRPSPRPAVDAGGAGRRPRLRPGPRRSFGGDSDRWPGDSHGHESGPSQLTRTQSQ